MRMNCAARLASPAVFLFCLAVTGLAAESTEAAERSAVHALPPPVKAAGNSPRATFYQAPPAPLGMAIRGDNWAVYSRGVNRINASAVHGAETWLATDAGVKLIDKTRRTVTHFTRLDGLPDDRVLAIAAEADTAWAVVATKHGESFVAALCEYGRAANRWRVLRETQRPIVPLPQPYSGAVPYLPGSPLENSLVAACPEKLCFVLSPVRRDSGAMALCYDRRLKLWDEIPCLPSLLTDRASVSITWLDVDRDAIWLGTTAGLLRYRLREKQWQRYLPDRMVYAATTADDGSLWLATYQGSTHPIDPKAPVGDSNDSAGHWFATHFMPKSAIVRHYSVPGLSNAQRAYGTPSPMMLSGISITEHSVWLTPGTRNAYNIQVPFYRLHPQDETWISYSVQNQSEMDVVPDAAIAQPTLPRTTLLSNYFPWRLTEWICRDGAETPPDTAAKSVTANRDADGTLWSTDGHVVLHTDEHGATLRRFGLDQVPLAVTPPVSTVTINNGFLYCMSSGDVQSYDLKKGVWRKIRLPRTGWSNPNDERLLPDGEHVWIGTPSMALRYDPQTEQFSIEFTTQNGGFRLLGSVAGTTWLRGPENLVYKASAQADEPETADLAPLPAEIASRYGTPLPFGMVSGILWFHLQDKKDAEKGLYIGYDLATKVWTREHAVGKPYPAPPSCLGSGRRTYIPVAEDDASVRCYDADTGQWSVAAPKEANGHGTYSSTLISVDDEELWSLDNRTRTLNCFHRKASNWTFHDMPQSFYIQQTGNEAVRAGDTIYLATNNGVWTFDVVRHAWTQLPGFSSRDIYLYGIVVEPNFVWSIARPSNGNQSFAVRLDKAKHQWTAWSQNDGFPERAYPNSIVADGKTAWVLASGECFHLDAVSNRWYSVSALLARPKMEEDPGPHVTPTLTAENPAKLQVLDIVPEGESVWLLPGAIAAQDGKAHDSTLLVRYDRTTGRYERLNPSQDVKVTGRSMQVDRDAVWVPTGSGVYRFGKSERGWRKVDPPPAALTWIKIETRTVVQHDRSYWFFGVDDAIHWEE